MRLRLTLLACCWAAPVLAQSGVVDGLRPRWAEGWSALSAGADLPRQMPRAPVAAGLLLWGTPRIGGFWTAGNPAAFRRELHDTLTDFAFGIARQSGTYRRPLDPGANRIAGTDVVGWRPVDSRFALLGRLAVDRDQFDPGSRADVAEAYPTSPFVTLDTARTATHRTRAHLEGVGSWQLGATSVGVTLGYETSVRETDQSGFIRRTRRVLPGAVLGVSQRLGGVEVGLVGRYRWRAESISLIELTSSGQVVELRGLKEAPFLDILNGYSRRIDEEARGGGVTLSGRLGPARWVGYAERSALRERLARDFADDPPSDRWRADGWTLGGALQRPLGGRRVVTATARYVTLSGSGDLVRDSVGTIFQADERSLQASGELRWVADSAGWSVVLGVDALSDRRVRNDLAVTLGSRVSGFTIGGHLGIAKALSPAWTFAGSMSLANYSATSAFPAPNVLGVAYRTFTLPELDIAARQARPWTTAVALRWRVAPKTSLWIAGRVERVSPVGRRGPSGFGPDGSRTTTGLTTGVTVR